MVENISPFMTFTIFAIGIGIGATVIMDVWGLFLKITFKVSGLNFSMVGRWIGYMFKGKFMHQGINNSGAITGEGLIGWTAHYAIGIIFAAALLLIWGSSWAENPSLMPALIVGIVTVAFPFLIIQPCFGIGVAASKLPNPNIARFKSLVTHMIFGIGLYVSAICINTFFAL